MKALDLFCGGGGASKGLYDVGFDLYGVDIKPQPRYPYKMNIFDVKNLTPKMLSAYDFIWASPPCQHYTQMLNHGMTDRKKHGNLIPFVRKLLIKSGKPYVIENVAGSPLLNPVMLCGEMFGLKVIRHRFFEASFFIETPQHIPHRKEGCIRKQNDGGYYYRVYGHETGKKNWGKAMGIDWLKWYELNQAIPPAYSEYIAKEWLRSNEHGT